MTRAKIERLFEDLAGQGEMLVVNGFDAAFLGIEIEYTEPPCAVYRAVYSVNKCITLLAREMSHDEASEYFWFNVAPGYVGQGSPVWVHTP